MLGLATTWLSIINKRAHITYITEQVVDQIFFKNVVEIVFINVTPYLQSKVVKSCPATAGLYHFVLPCV